MLFQAISFYFMFFSHHLILVRVCLLSFILFHVISGQFMPPSCKHCAAIIPLQCYYHAIVLILSGYYHATIKLLSSDCHATVLFTCNFILLSSYIILHHVNSCYFILLHTSYYFILLHITSCYLMLFCVILCSLRYLVLFRALPLQ